MLRLASAFLYWRVVISQAPLAELMTFGQDVSAEARTPLHSATMKYILFHSHTEYSHSMTQVDTPAEILLPYDILCKSCYSNIKSS